MLLVQMLEQFENVGGAERLGPVSSMMLIALWRKSSKIGNPTTFNVSYRDLTFFSGITKPSDFTQALNRLVFYGYIKYNYDKIEFIEVELNLNLYVPFERVQDEPNTTRYQNVMDALERHYILRRGQGFFPSAIDYGEMRTLAETTDLTVEQAIEWLDDCFEQYTPRHERDSIRSFKYCASYIYNRLNIERAKKGTGEKHDRIQKSDPKHEFEEFKPIDAVAARRKELLKSGFFKNLGNLNSNF